MVNFGFSVILKGFIEDRRRPTADLVFKSSIERLLARHQQHCRLLLRVSPKMWHLKALPLAPSVEMVCLL